MAFHSLENDPVYLNLQTEMVRMQKHVGQGNKRIVIVFEGRDSAGKGGAIMRFVRFINPRGYKIVALNKPTDIERGQWYFQRYIKEMPDPGQIVFFDRSWYNRAVVEPVMGFCEDQQYNAFMDQVNVVEKLLVDDGVILIKFWFSIDHEEQKKRLEERHHDPLKQWKLSTVDMQAQMKWDDYTHYKQLMFEQTSTPVAPWVVIKGNDKNQARIEAMRYVLSKVDYPEKGMTGETLQPNSDILTVFKKAPIDLID